MLHCLPVVYHHFHSLTTHRTVNTVTTITIHQYFPLGQYHCHWSSIIHIINIEATFNNIIDYQYTIANKLANNNGLIMTGMYTHNHTLNIEYQ
jgi:hypothetical protein